ncbi:MULTISPECIES: hypothetical protein [unclassified Marinobacter]|jgi:hypothetical protein|uniref:hypothetical protein n=1 Tax=unclassified Marinobacter TaxID=83889 RepID=UPI0018F194D1|nr:MULTISPECIES: hypothetical protein [unclassified Marinobacter]|tara:strand:- start:7862 stop:9100 length:1239 start_codon:yes stop_codon:yes gene_type:complete
MRSLIFAQAIVFSTFSISAEAQNFFTVSSLKYEGAARLPIATYGESRISYTEGTFTITPDGSTMFVVGHAQDQAIAEFETPKLSLNEDISGLPMARNVQPFSSFLNRIPTGNPEGISRITGMQLVDEKLIVNGVEFYDGEANNTDTTFIIQNPQSLEESQVSGFFKLDGDSHAAGWITEIPNNWQSALGGNFIFGFASNYPINARNSMGPSAFAVEIQNVLNASAGDRISSRPLLDYPVDNPLVFDHYNEKGGNDLWTEVSKANIGFIVPGTNTYAVFGSSGGHDSGVGYKITQETGYECGGACPYDSRDVYNYYWLYNLEDLSQVVSGSLAPHSIKPYDYGKFTIPFENIGYKTNLIVGANFNRSEGKLYFLLGDADTLQSRYETAPLLVAFSIQGDQISQPKPPSSISIQ